MFNVELLGNMEEQRVSVSPLCPQHICCVLMSARKSGEASPEYFNAWNYREDGWSFLVLFIFVIFFSLWKHAEVMNYYLELALCQAVISELQTAWRLSSGESKSCAFAQTNEH